ncbi:Activity-dependent neuroprotector homeobox protein 2 [Bagarius yarrelli]|uniref:Activity-dependent neuroprotector homeobox protein 2 n=1 Tax=Bagarius yarrelli TaxID=175774 RepID=A0A556U177_BAGYA|nr:Activity-dependent neuroprotector homeobox protein 2 [Bagarius yarrelli]
MVACSVFSRVTRKMYQVPVNDVARLRRSRKKVKSILCDIALQNCQDLIQEYKAFDAGEASFNNTEWTDFTDGHVGKRKKKWKYRTEALCCSLCWYSSRSFYTFRSHVMRYHREDLDVASLLTCPSCPFVSRPETINQHLKYFHPKPVKPAAPTISVIQQPKTLSLTSTSGLLEDRYMCVNCGYSDSLLYVMKKHVLVNHYATLLNRYFGHRMENVQNTEGQNKGDRLLNSKYYCKECKLPAETIEHLLYHILSSDKHKDLHWHIMPFISEKTPKAGSSNLPNLAPNFNQVKQIKGQSVAKSNGSMLLSGTTNTTGLLCSPGGRQVFLSSQTPALLQQQTSSGIHQGLTSLSSPSIVKSLNMVMPNMQNASKQVPVAMTVPRLSQSQSAQQVLLPPGVQVNLPGRTGVRPPVLFTHRLQLNQTASRQPIIASQSVRLIPTGNKVNGVPTYTLAPVQLNTVPGQPSASQVVSRTPIVVNTNGPHSSVITPSKATLLPAKPAPSGLKEVARKKNRPNKLAVFAPFLKKQNDDTVKCLRCKVLLTEQWIFQHLLHGLRCLFCPLMFYSFKQIMEHSNKEHNLKIKKNRDYIKREYKLDCDDEGSIEFSTFSLNTDVPKDLLDNRELNLVLVTGAQEKIYIKMYPDSAKPVYPPTLKTIPTACPFCQIKLLNLEDYENHLKMIHHIVPTIHAILKSPAFKCIYCFGVYSDKSTPKTISIHVQRCRCAPKSAKEAEKQLHPDTAVHINGDMVNQQSFQPHIILNADEKQTAKERSKRDSLVGSRNIRTCKTEVYPPVELILDPSGMEMQSFEDRKEFLTKYFHTKPYPSKVEMLTLAARLWLNKTDVLHWNKAEQVHENNPEEENCSPTRLQHE